MSAQATSIKAEKPAKLSSFTALLSAACAIHCLAVPIATAMTPVAMTASSSSVHDWLVPAVVAFVAITAGASFLHSRSARTLAMPALGLACFLGGHWLEHDLGVRFAALIGGVLLSAVMLLGARRERAHAHCTAHH